MMIYIAKVVVWDHQDRKTEAYVGAYKTGQGAASAALRASQKLRESGRRAMAKGVEEIELYDH